jgi:hypothetical protein
MIVFTAASGAPGVTTTALTLATAWPRDRLLLEADAKGGDLRLRFGLHREPSMATLAATGLGRLGAGDLSGHSQELRDGTKVIVGPSSPAEAEAALRAIVPSLPVDGGPDLLVDCGRYGTGEGVRSLVRSASLVLVVIGQGRLAPHEAACAIEHAGHLVERLRPHAQDVAAVVVGREPYSQDEIARSIAAEVLSVLPRDAEGVELVGSAPLTRRERSRARRSALLRLAPAAAMRVASATSMSSSSRVHLGDSEPVDSQ